MIIVINFKTYKQGRRSLKLAKIIEKFNKNIIVGVQPTEIMRISEKTKLKVYSEHVDPFLPGRNTGYLIPEEIKAAGAKGVFFNHSEHPLKIKILKDTIKRCKTLKLKVLVFVKTLKEAKNIEKLHPDFIVFEPPELVSSKRSVSQEKPQLIKKFAKNLKTKFLVGAGIHTNEDVKVAMRLGASGVALSSAVTKSLFPRKVLKRLFS